MYAMEQQYFMQHVQLQNSNIIDNANNIATNSIVVLNQKMDRKDKGKKPKGRMSNYTFFVQMCREEHRKKHPN